MNILKTLKTVSMIGFVSDGIKFAKKVKNGEGVLQAAKHTANERYNDVLNDPIAKTALNIFAPGVGTTVIKAAEQLTSDKAGLNQETFAAVDGAIQATSALSTDAGANFDLGNLTKNVDLSTITNLLGAII